MGPVLGTGFRYTRAMSTSPSFDRSQHSVLVVDDNEASLYAIGRSLRGAGYHVVEATGGAKALELAEFASAVVLDIHLPDLLGFEVCRLMRERAVNLPVICISAMYVSEDDRSHGMDVGADAYLPAPIDPVMLVSTVDKLIVAGPGA